MVNVDDIKYDFKDDSNKINFDEKTRKNEIEKMLIDAEEEVNRKIDEANRQAQLIISEAYEDSKKIFKNAQKDGYNDGYSKAQEIGKKEADKIIQEALNIKKKVKKEKEKAIKKLEEDIINLVLSSVEKITYSKLDDNPDMILGLIKQGLEKCNYTESLVLRVSPEDYEYVENEKDKILCLTENIDNITVKKDTSLKKGSCQLDTISGTIDSSLSTQLTNLDHVFRKLLGSE